MSENPYHQRIIEYYEKAEISYRDVWDLDHSMAFHCGFWTKGVKSIRQALLNQNDVMAKWVHLQPGELLLDAGCGIGGSALYLAQNYQCKTVGISIVPYQIEMARVKAKELELTNLASFEIADYCNTSFEDISFDIVWAIESVCYTPDKKDFLKEAFRLLKPGGRLIVADGFRIHDSLEGRNEEIMRLWEEGYAVESLGLDSYFEHSLSEVGFQNIERKNATSLIMPSARKLYYFGLAAHYYRSLLNLFGKKYGNEITIKNTQAAINQYLGIKKGLWKYLVYIAKKGNG